MSYFDDLRFEFVGLDMAYGRMSFDQAWPGLYSVQFVLRGTTYFGRDGRPPVDLEAPAIYWIDPGHTYQLGTRDSNDLRHYANFSGRRGSRLLREGFCSLSDQGWMSVSNPSEIDRLYRELVEVANSPAPREHAHGVVLLEQMLVALMQSPVIDSRAHPHRQRVEKLAGSIHRDPLSDYDFEQIADSHHLSYSHFRKLFREYMHRSPHDYLLLSRMREAARRLRDQRKQVKEVAFELGYDDPAQFTRCFKKQLGVSPQQYRVGLP